MNFQIPFAEPAGVFATILLVVLVAPTLSHLLRLPPFLFYLAAGIGLGPAGLGLLSASGPMETLGALGLGYAFFQDANELDASGLWKRPLSSIAQASGMLLPFALVTLATLAIAPLFGHTGAAPWALALATGAAAVSFSMPVSWEAGHALPERSYAPFAGATALSSTLIVAAIALSGGLWAPNADPGTVLLAFGGFALGTGLLLGLMGRPFFKRVKSDGSIETAFMLAIAFALAWLSSALGFHPGLGTFVVGLTLGQFIPHEGAAMQRIRFAGNSLLVPAFIMLAGMRLDVVAAFSNPAFYLLSAAIVTLSFLGKWIAFQAAGKSQGLSRDERTLVFASGIGQGSFTIALCFVAYGIGLLDGIAYAAAVAAALASSVAAPAIARKARARLAQRGDQSQGTELVPERILVALGNPKSLRGLMATAFSMRERGSPEPLYPVCVMGETSDGEAIRETEHNLAQAIAMGTATGVPVLPVMKTGINAGEGIVASAREYRASTILIGWNKAARASSSSFGSVIDQIVSGCKGQLFVARTSPSIDAATTYAIVFPPLIDRHPGYARVLAVLKTLLSKRSARILAYAVESDAAAAKAALKYLKPQASTVVHAISSWKDMPKAIKRDSGGQLGMIVLAVRPGDPAWHPSSERLPHILSEDFADSPLLVVYLASELREASTHRVVDVFSAACADKRVFVGLKSGAIVDGIADMLEPTFGADRRTRNRLAQVFTEIAQRQPIELEPGVLLLHAHLGEVKEPLILFGARPEGYRILALAEPVKVLVILCAPEAQAPEAHLATLTAIAESLKREGLIEALGNARTMEELAAFK